MKTPSVMSIFVGAFSIGFFFYLLLSKSLTEHEKIQDMLNLAITSTGIISAIFVIYSYIQTNLAFVSSQRPSLLVQVVNSQEQSRENPQAIVPITYIHYKNITNNPFHDLTFHIRVYTEYNSVDLNHLFREKMYMSGQDSRQRRFETIAELNSKGFNILQQAASGNSIKLEIVYSYIFLNKPEEILVQEYKWNNSIKVWEII